MKVEDTFTPELTSPVLENLLLEARLIENMLVKYVDCRNSLLKAWKTFALMTLEDAQNIHTLSCKDTNHSFELQRQEWEAMNGLKIFIDLDDWGRSMGLLYSWVKVLGLRILRQVQKDNTDGNNITTVNLLIGLARFRGSMMALPAMQQYETDAAGIFGPMLPRYKPANQSEKQYRAECKKVLDEYILREFRAHRAFGLARAADAPAVAEHLAWLAVRIKEKKSWRDIAQDEANGSVGHTAVWTAVKKLAQKLDVQLDQIL